VALRLNVLHLKTMPQGLRLFTNICWRSDNLYFPLRYWQSGCFVIWW